MYTLYFVPDTCSLATQVVLRELEQPVKLINKQSVNDFKAINPVGVVPVLDDGQHLWREGAAVMLYILKNHPSHMFPEDDAIAQQKVTQDIMFANATMHPAYGRMFFAAGNIESKAAQQAVFDAAAIAINGLWEVVEDRLQTQPFLGGQHVSPADIMLTVYSRWGAAFPVNIKLGEQTTRMINHVLALPSFQAALAAEKEQSLTAA